MMEGLLLGGCLCASGAACALWRRTGAGDVGRRIRRVFGAVCIVTACFVFYFSLSLSSSTVSGSLPQFLLATVNCSLPTAPRNLLKGEVGVVSRHQWFHAVGHSLDDLRIHWNFPGSPGSEDTIHTLRREFEQKAWKAIGGKYAHRVFGYLLPPETGRYVFQVSLSRMSAIGSVEFWLSPTSNPQQSLLLAFTSIPKKGRRYSQSASHAVFLQSCGVYYFEFLQQSYNGRSVAEVKWKLSDWWQFHAIPSTALANVESGNQIKTMTLPSLALQRHEKKRFVCNSVNKVVDVKVLPDCTYQSVMGYPHEIKTYWGHKEVITSQVYPHSDTGTKPVSQFFVNKILDMYIRAYNKSTNKGEVVGVHYMDTTLNMKNKYLDQTAGHHRPVGNRILLETDIKSSEGEVIHTSEYVYLASGSDTLCHTSNFQWKKNVDVYLVVSVKNLGLWVKHLIHNMEHTYKMTGDNNFELVIVDYQSEDLDVEAELKASSLPRWKVIRMTGGFSRSQGLQAGIDYVTDRDSIVMTIDMHLTLPPGFVEYTRRHVVQGKMGFAPMFFRLNEGQTELTRAGFWETLTYGLLGMYKTDWVASGGFDVEKYTTKWGGEDWDAVDRVRAKGLEIFRLGYPGLDHYYHTRAHMWGH